MVVDGVDPAKQMQWFGLWPDLQAPLQPTRKCGEGRQWAMAVDSGQWDGQWIVAGESDRIALPAC